LAQGDLTECGADAIVNPANSSLDHAGSAAAAMRHKGGRVIDDESQQWIDTNKQLPVGLAMVTTSGRPPCRYMIHTVGPPIHSSQPRRRSAATSRRRQERVA
jgi:O-acetyl-ADP-ribose deacetylase